MILRLISKEHLVDNIWAFRFQPSEPLVYMAGQYVRVELVHDAPDEEGTKRWFTNSAAPFEGILQISTRVTGTTFKRALSKLEVGSTELQLIESPEGDFVWQDTERPNVFVAAGIGVTPFRSILRQRAHDGLPLSATLIYGGRTESVPFKDELAQWSQTDPRFEVKYIIGEPLTTAKLTEVEPDLNKSMVYLSGPEQMVHALGKELIAHGLPEAQFKHDGFPNYNESNY